jgi:hypothetical protein
MKSERELMKREEKQFEHRPFNLLEAFDYPFNLNYSINPLSR